MSTAPTWLRKIPRSTIPPPIDETSFLAASFKHIVLGTRDGQFSPVLVYNGDANIHEPVLVRPRPREPVVTDHTDQTQATGQMFLADIYRGRNMEGVKPGQIKKLLILETLPKPVNFSGGMDLTSWLGTFLLERVLGTVPVEDDGSAFFEVPAGRPVFFVALDANDMSVKRMQSFTNVMPGESLSCVGCHEQRMEAPLSTPRVMPAAVRRPASRIEPFDGVPDVLGFRRHIQPILDKHCVSCHRPQDRRGQVVLSDDLGPCWSISYYTLLAARQVADARNGLGNQKPRTIGSSASALMSKIDGSHYDAKLTADEWRTIWLWIETGAPYAGKLRCTSQRRGTGPGGDCLFRSEGAGPRSELSSMSRGRQAGAAAADRYVTGSTPSHHPGAGNGAVRTNRAGCGSSILRTRPDQHVPSRILASTAGPAAG